MTAWSLFPVIVVRSAGFNASVLQRFDAQGSRSAHHQMRTIGRETAQRRDALLGWVAQCRHNATTTQNRASARSTEKKILRNRQVDLDKVPEPWIVQLAPWNRQVAGNDQAITSYAAAVKLAAQDEIRLLKRISSSPLIIDAIMGNSPDAADRWHGPSAHYGSKYLTVLYGYLQRFCGKNDTGGHYGPVNFATVSQTLGDSRQVYVEALGDGSRGRRLTLISQWAGRSVADVIGGSLLPFEERRVYELLPREGRPEVGMLEKNILDLADGEMTLGEIAGALGSQPDSVIAATHSLQSAGMALVGLIPPSYIADPIDYLVNRLPVSGEPDLAQSLQRFIQWREAFAAAPLGSRRSLLREGEALFTGFTGKSARRSGEKYYADRLIATEESVGNVARLDVSEEWSQSLQERVQTCLDVVATEAVDRRIAVHSLLRDRLRNSGRTLFSASEIAVTLESLQIQEALDALHSERAGRWRKLLTDASEKPVARLTRGCLEKVGLIKDGLDDWPLFGAADIMFASRRGPEELGKDGNLILAEVHHIMPTTQYPYRWLGTAEQLRSQSLAAAISTLTAPSIPLIAAVRRTGKAIDYSPVGHWVLLLDWRRREGEYKCITMDELAVEMDEGGFTLLHSPTGQHLALFPDYDDAEPGIGLLHHLALPALDKGPVLTGPRTPRILIDGVVYQRQTWCFEEDEWPTSNRSTSDNVTDLLDWQVHHDLPNEVFVTTQGDSETKPLLLQFGSDLSSRCFYKHTRHASKLQISEALPALIDHWLSTPDGRLASEFRCTFFRKRIR